MTFTKRILTVCGIMALLLTTGCSQSADTYNKSILCAAEICDDPSYIYCQRENGAVLKISKKTFEITPTEQYASCMMVYDGVLYRLYEDALYKGDDRIEIPDMAFENFLVGAFGVWMGSTMLGNCVNADIEHSETWENVRWNFPINDNRNKSYDVEIGEDGDAVAYVINDVVIDSNDNGSFLPYNDEYYIFDEHVYYAKQSTLYDVSLTDGQITTRPYEADSILSVGHGAIYYFSGDDLMRECISTGVITECTSDLPEGTLCYLDSYRDTVYIIDLSAERDAVSIAAFSDAAE